MSHCLHSEWLSLQELLQHCTRLAWLLSENDRISGKIINILSCDWWRICKLYSYRGICSRLLSACLRVCPSFLPSFLLFVLLSLSSLPSVRISILSWRRGVPISYPLLLLHCWKEFDKTFTESLLHISIVHLLFWILVQIKLGVSHSRTWLL